MRHCDVLIVGGGPAGSSCAWGLRQRGLDVVVLDRAEFPRDKVCAGWITPQVCQSLEIDIADYRKARTLQAITGFSVERSGDAQTRVDFGEVVSFGIRRSEFDHYLLERCDADLRLGEPLLDLRREAGRFVLNGEISARLLVGAGGHFCPVAHSLGIPPSENEPTTVLTRGLEFEMSLGQQTTCTVRADQPELILERDLEGYGWLVRKGDWLNIGVGRQDPVAFPDQVDRFLESLAARGRIPAGTPRQLQGHAFLLYPDAPRPVAHDGVMLLGDAAGLAFGRSGEGIRPAVESGLLAARAIRDGQSSEDTAREYQLSVLRRFGTRHGQKASGLSARLPAKWRGSVAGRCLATPWFARKVVADGWLRRGLPALGPDGAA